MAVRAQTDLHPALADIDLNAEAVSTDGLVAEDAFPSTIGAKNKVNQLDQTRLAGTVAGLAISCGTGLFRDQQVQPAAEANRLEPKKSSWRLWKSCNTLI